MPITNMMKAGADVGDHGLSRFNEVFRVPDLLRDLRGRLRIAAPLSFGPTHLAPVLAQLARRHRRLHVHASYSDRFVDIVGEGFDCAIRVGRCP
jgi:DNA-binding transcriptional LysR family regulator